MELLLLVVIYTPKSTHLVGESGWLHVYCQLSAWQSDIAASIFRMPHASRRAVAIEIRCQNVALCLTLITISYDADVFLHIAVYAELFGVCGYSITFGCIGLYHLHKRIMGRIKSRIRLN